MSRFVPISEDELVRARSDPKFRQRLLSQNMEILLEGLKRARKSPDAAGSGADLIREGAQLAVRLAEIIQAPSRPDPKVDIKARS